MDKTLEKSAHVSIEDDEQSSIYAGSRTDGTLNKNTRVRRLFNFAQIFFFALGYMSSWEAVAVNIGLAFYNGGPRAVVWGFFVVVPGILCQVASLAELASIQPIAGAQYHWTYHLAPEKSRRFITWMQGWLTWFSWISLLAGVVNIGTYQITTLAATQYGYTPQNWHTVLIMYATLIAMGLVNMFAFWVIPWLELVSGILHVLLWIIFMVVLLTMAPRHDKEFVFFSDSKLSGWTNPYVSFNLGMVLVTWGFVGFDGAIHLSEEVRKARYAVPRSIFWTICINALMAFTMIIVLLFCLGDVDDVVSAAYAVVPIVVNATGSVVGGCALIGGLFIINTSCAIASVATASRLTWAWSRDGALPAYFAHIDPRSRVPVRSVWLPILIVMLLTLLNLAGYIAFSVIISLSTFGLYQSYAIAIGCMLHARLTGRHTQQTEWSLGRLGVPINAIALLYSIYMGIWLVCPAYQPINGLNMNYALPINAFVVLGAVVSYFAWAKKNWKGLNRQVIEAVVADADRKTKD